MDYQEIVDFYRQLGREFHSLGADKVVLCQSKKLMSGNYKMELSVLVFGCDSKDIFESHARKTWPDMKIEVLMENQLMLDQRDELMEDGVLL